MDSHTSSGSIKQPPIQIQQQQTNDWIDAWIRKYKNLTKRSTKQPVFPISQIQKQSIDLKVSLQMLLQDATRFVEYWTNDNIQFDDRRSFPTFLFMLQMSGLDWHKYNVSEGELERVQDSDLNPSTQPNHVVQSHPDWVMANKYYCKSLALMRLLQEIRSKSFDAFRQEQATMLESFLDHLIMIQKEQRVVVNNFSEHLEQLRSLATEHLQQFSYFDAASSSNAVDDDGNRDKCPSILSKHPTNLRDSLHIISRESTWLLKKLKESCFTSPSFIEESEKIAKTIVDFISKFEESKENKYILIRFGDYIKRLREEGVGKGTVIENLLGCLEHVCSVIEDDYYYVEKSRLCSLDIEYEEAESKLCEEALELIGEALELIGEARKKLHSCRFSNLCGGGSPLGSITLWRILFESSVAGLRLDLISKKWEEADKLGARLFGEGHLHLGAVLFEMYRQIDLLLSDGEGVLLDFVAMHRTVAEIAYMLGDAFTTGGAGKSDEMDMVSDFPWDNHNVPHQSWEYPSWEEPPSVSDPVPLGRYNDELIVGRYSDELIVGGCKPSVSYHVPLFSYSNKLIGVGCYSDELIVGCYMDVLIL